MPDDINPGHDCCRDANRPSRFLHVTPSVVWAKPGDEVVLHAKTVYYDCDSSCIYWRVLTGSGVLRHEFGKETLFYVAKDKQGCEANATIGMYCGGVLHDVARIAVNTYYGDERAYYRAGQWRDGEYPELNDCVPFAERKDECVGASRKTSCIKIKGYDCAGNLQYTTALGVRQVCTQRSPGVWELHESLFGGTGVGIRYEFKSKIPPLAFKLTKQAVLDNWSYEVPRLEVKQLVSDPYPHFIIIRRHVEPPIEPGGVMDVRSNEMILKGCCNPYIQ